MRTCPSPTLDRPAAPLGAPPARRARRSAAPRRRMLQPLLRIIAAALTLGGLHGPAAACEDLQGPVESIERQVILGDLEPIRGLLERAEAAVACAEQLPPTQLARLFRAEGAWLSLLGAEEEATLAFASAARLAPGRWSPALPADMEGTFKAASARQGELGTGTLRVEGQPLGIAIVEVNGQATGPRADLPAGLHTVRIRGEQGHSGHLIMIYEGEVVVVEPRWRGAPSAVGAAPAPEIQPAAPAKAPDSTAAGAPLEPASAPAQASSAPLPPALPAPRPARVSWAGPGRPWLIAAGGAAVGAGVTAAVARAQIGRATTAETLGQLQQAERTQLIMGVSSYSLMVGTGALLTVGFTR